MPDLLDVYEILLQHGLERGVKTANLARGLYQAFLPTVDVSATEIFQKNLELEKPQLKPARVKKGARPAADVKAALIADFQKGARPVELRDKYGVTYGIVKRWTDGVKPKTRKKR